MNDITPQHSLDEITALERQVADKDDEITRLRAQLEQAREGFKEIEANAALEKSPTVFRQIANERLRQLDHTGGGSE